MTSLQIAIQEAEEELKHGNIVSFDDPKDAIDYLSQFIKSTIKD